MTSDAVTPVLSHVDAHLGESLDRLMGLLRIPSISTDPAFKAECDRTADWLVDELADLGFDAAKHVTPGHPMVVAQDDEADEDALHVLFYGHYDVQPVDPLNLWPATPSTRRSRTRPPAR
jgi:Acetylornithine deacetylase/Succinyl-diaminopimelate desuccinylase and related deacylases